MHCFLVRWSGNSKGWAKMAVGRCLRHSGPFVAGPILVYAVAMRPAVAAGARHYGTKDSKANTPDDWANDEEISATPLQGPQGTWPVHAMRYTPSSRYLKGIMQSRVDMARGKLSALEPSQRGTGSESGRSGSGAFGVRGSELGNDYGHRRTMRLRSATSNMRALFAEKGPPTFHRPPEGRHKKSMHALPDHLQVSGVPRLKRSILRGALSVGADQVLHCKGRVHSVRRMGPKLIFIDIVDHFEPIQVMVDFQKLQSEVPVKELEDVKEDKGEAVEDPLGPLPSPKDGSRIGRTPPLTLEDFKRVAAELHRGMFIRVTGKLLVTPAGQLTLSAIRFPKFLTNRPEMPLPESITDEETRIQHRNVDLMLNRRSTDVLRARSTILRVLRTCLSSTGFTEVSTPILAAAAGGAAARPFVTASTDLPGRKLALRVAPELWLKRLIAGGLERVYEMGPCFRNEGTDATHNPEFTMLEFYEAHRHLGLLMVRAQDMIERAASAVMVRIDERPEGQHPGAPRLWELPPLRADHWRAPGRSWPKIRFIPALQGALGFSLPDLSAPDALARLTELMAANKVDVGRIAGLTLPALLDRLQSRFLEPQSPDSPPLFITNHPACMSPLALTRSDLREGQPVSVRAELFIGGFEVANMYEEEHDAARQGRNFLEQARLRRLVVAEDGVAVEERRVDEDAGEADEPRLSAADASYVDALRAGMPPTAGFGMGVDRLVMLLTGSHRMRDVLSFGPTRNVVGLSGRYEATMARASAHASSVVEEGAGEASEGEKRGEDK